MVRLNGENGGNGHIRVSGDFQRHDNRLNVVGGDGDFEGVAGKMLFHSVNRSTDRLHFDLTRLERVRRASATSAGRVHARPAAPSVLQTLLRPYQVL